MESKTTLYRQRKIDQINQMISSLVFLISNIKKSELFIVRSSDLKKVLKIATMWERELKDYRKLSSNSSIKTNDLDHLNEKS